MREEIGTISPCVPLGPVADHWLESWNGSSRHLLIASPCSFQAPLVVYPALASGSRMQALLTRASATAADDHPPSCSTASLAPPRCSSRSWWPGETRTSG